MSQSTVQPGSLYGVPGITQRFEQPETSVGVFTAQALSAIANDNQVQNFQQTDIVHWWEQEITFANAWTGGTVSITSQYLPYNALQACSIQMQGQYKPIDVVSGVDLAIFQLYRPMRGSAQMAYQPLLGTNPANTFANANFAQANLVGLPAETATSTPIPIYLEWPTSLWFDQYWDLAEDGSINGPPISAYVSPQYMSGGQRVVKPKIQYAPANASNSDQGPIVYSVAPTGGSGSFTSNWRRVGVYASVNPATMPPVFNWQYQRHSFQFGVGGKTKVVVPITDYGQVLSVFLRFYDPTAGAPLLITSSTYLPQNLQLLYGSNLPRFYDDMPAMQKRFLDQHGFLPPVGTIIWDMALTDTGGYVTNSKAINTLTNANVTAVVQFGAALSATAYVVCGIESLVYVAIQ